MAMEAFFNHSSTTPRAIMRLFKYLEDRPSFSSPDAIIPTVDLELRLELIKDICEKYETANIETLHFTKLQLSALLIMPLDTLRLAKQMPSLISTWLPTDLYPRFSKPCCSTLYYKHFLNTDYLVMQGKLLDSQAGSGGTSQVSASASVNSSASVHRNAREREKVCPILHFHKNTHSLPFSFSLSKAQAQSPSLPPLNRSFRDTDR